MAEIASQVYERSPYWAQGLLVTCKSWLNAKSRFAHEFRRAQTEVLNGQWRSAEEWEALQSSRLSAIVDDARKNVPYYGEKLSELKPGASLREMVSAIPLLEKRAVRENPGQFHHRDLAKMRTVVFRTSGTTGSPLAIRHLVEAHSLAWAAMDRLWRWAGVRYGDRRLSFTGNRIITHRRPNGPFGHRAGSRMLMSVYHLGSKTVDAYLDEIERFQPAFIDGYPSAIEVCARRALETGREFGIQACFPTSETLSAESRAVIERGLGTRVYNQYGSAEGLAVVGECPAGSMHVSPEVGLVEVLRSDGTSAAPGEVGELVLTTLNNRAMPLLRYRIGDAARAAGPGDRCACGRAMPTVGEIVGRQDDVVITRDGRQIGMLSFNVFKWSTGLKASQIVQLAPDHFVLKLVPGGDYQPSVAENAKKVLMERVGEDVTVEVELCADLPLTKSGKLRSVISHVSAGEVSALGR